MKKIIFLPLALLFFSCGNSPKVMSHQDSLLADSTTVVNQVNDSLKKDARKIGGDKPQDQILIEQGMDAMRTSKNACVGFWVGTFGHNKINIVITGVADGMANGYSVCAGNFRQLKGKVAEAGNSTFHFVLDEPGTDKYDGHFDFIVSPNENKCSGNWSPFQKDATDPKEFTLERKIYTYDTSLGIYPQASQRLLQKEDVENLAKEELTEMRTEIYARHGYSFKNRNIRQAFDTTGWYIPMGIDIRQNLTDIEVKNIDLIYSYEMYAESEYDDYGR